METIFSPSAHRGSLSIAIGPMFSSKTTWLNSKLTELADIGLKTIKINHIDDNRKLEMGNTTIGTSHSSSFTGISSKITCIAVSSLSEVDVTSYDAIGIDESQWYEDLYEKVEYWVEILGKHVRVAGLDGDSFKRKFGHTLDLIPICDEVIKLHARCVPCLNELGAKQFKGNIMSISAPFTERLDGSLEQKNAGGKDKYRPVCRYHHSLATRMIAAKIE